MPNHLPEARPCCVVQSRAESIRSLMDTLRGAHACLERSQALLAWSWQQMERYPGISSDKARRFALQPEHDRRIRRTDPAP